MEIDVHVILSIGDLLSKDNITSSDLFSVISGSP